MTVTHCVDVEVHVVVTSTTLAEVDSQVFHPDVLLAVASAFLLLVVDASHCPQLGP